MTKRKTLTIQLMEANLRIASLEQELSLHTVPPIPKHRPSINDSWRQAFETARAIAMATGKTTRVTH